MASQIVFGYHPIMEVLNAGRRKITLLRYSKENERRLSELLKAAADKGVRTVESANRELIGMSGGAPHQGVVAEVEPPSILDLKTFTKKMLASGTKPVIAILDSIVDPHNFGAILRSAEFFGVGGVIFPKDRSADINSTVVKTSAGATEYLDFCKVTNLARTIEELKNAGFFTVAADIDGRVDIRSFEPQWPLCIVLGSEGEGVRHLVKKTCDDTIRIPRKGQVSSLNVSNAAALIFHSLAG